MTKAPIGPTVPDAGVIAARPAIAPVANPTAVGLPYRIHSMAIQVKAAREGEIWVTSSAIVAWPLAASALPPLKPNQPTQSMAFPVRTMGIL